jgi:hypothetical protein
MMELSISLALYLCPCLLVVYKFLFLDSRIRNNCGNRWLEKYCRLIEVHAAKLAVKASSLARLPHQIFLDIE